MRIVEPKVELVSVDRLQDIELAGRVSHRSHTDNAERFCTRMLALGHHSVLEFGSAHVVWTCDRGVSHEIVRHRMASFCQESTRYVDYVKDGMPVIQPPGLDDHTLPVWYAAVSVAESGYKRLRESGAKLDVARSVLPTCTATKIHIKANIREWLHIIELRTSRHAHPQIRSLALATAVELDGAFGVGWFSHLTRGDY